MTFRNRPGQNPEQRFDEIEKNFGLDNLPGTDIKTSFPVASDKFSMGVIDDSGTFYLVVTAKGSRYRVALTEF